MRTRGERSCPGPGALQPRAHTARLTGRPSWVGPQEPPGRAAETGGPQAGALPVPGAALWACFSPRERPRKPRNPTVRAACQCQLLAPATPPLLHVIGLAAAPGHTSVGDLPFSPQLSTFEKSVSGQRFRSNAVSLGVTGHDPLPVSRP